MNSQFLDKWAPEAWALEAPLDKLPVPVPVFVGEATDVARFARIYWERPKGEPSLSSAVSDTGRFRPEIRQELLELIDAYQTAECEYQLTVEQPIADIGDQAQSLLAVFRDTLGWYFTDAGDALGQARLDKLNRLHDAAYSHDALAAALFNYAALAETVADHVQGLLGFDRSKIDEARKLAGKLRARSGVQDVPDAERDPRRLYELRFRIATLLYDRMQVVRTAARVVFKDHPALIRKVTSDYQRARQAEYRRRQEEADTEATPTEPAAPTPALVAANTNTKEDKTEAA